MHKNDIVALIIVGIVFTIYNFNPEKKIATLIDKSYKINKIVGIIAIVALILIFIIATILTIHFTKI